MQTKIVYFTQTKNECPADCGILEEPPNGSVSTINGTKFGQFAQYSCDAGFELTGNSRRQCSVNGTWTEETPLCKIKGNASYYIVCYGFILCFSSLF